MSSMNEDDDENGEEAEEEESRAAGNLSDDDDVGRTDDPVRMYLREMGAVELLSREGEIAIAKRIEAGRDTMIGGICESPLTMRALLHWRDQIADRRRRVLLRDVIDLDATYGGNGRPVIENAGHASLEDGISDGDRKRMTNRRGGKPRKTRRGRRRER